MWFIAVSDCFRDKKGENQNFTGSCKSDVNCNTVRDVSLTVLNPAQVSEPPSVNLDIPIQFDGTAAN